MKKILDFIRTKKAARILAQIEKEQKELVSSIPVTSNAQLLSQFQAKEKHLNELKAQFLELMK